MRYLMIFSYDGSCFKGYQRQKGLKTVQGEIEKELSLLENSKVEISSSGRTDIGVHAINQKAHFDLDKNIKTYNIKKFLNKKLNNEIYVKNVEVVHNDFHARYDCVSKEYHYFINVGEYDIFKRNYVFQYNQELDINKMKDALNIFVGTHNFKSLCNDSKERCNFIRTITNVNIDIKDSIIEISIVGNGFLKQMVRNIVGILIKVGRNEKNIDDVKKILMMEDRCYNIKAASSCGLYLWDVYYK